MNGVGMSRTNRKSACCNLGDVLQPRFFKALGEPNRVALLATLAQCGRPCTVSEMAECCPINVSVVSRHLAMLRDAGILDAQRQGKEVYYSVRFPKLIETLRSIADALETCCGEPAPSQKGKRK